jgi:hypothetical protein
MKFINKKEEFIYWMRRSEIAKENKDKKNYFIYLTKAQRVLDEIEKKDGKENT